MSNATDMPDTWYSPTVGLVQRSPRRELVMVETGRVLMNLPKDAKRLISEVDMRAAVAKSLRDIATELDGLDDQGQSS